MSNPYDIAKKIRESRKGNENLFPEACAAIYANVEASEDETSHAASILIAQLSKPP